MFYVALYALAAKKFGGARFNGALRVAAYTTAVTVAFGAIGAHKARAAVAEKGLEFGEDMASLASMVKGANTFRLNGQVVHASSTDSLEGMKTILDKYDAACRANGGAEAPVWEALPNTAGEPPKDGGNLTMMPILRQETQGKGMVACFVPDKSREHTSRSLQAALQEFQETGNLGAVGRFRYAYVREGTTGSSITTVWTDGSFNVKALMPEEGRDAQGTDPVTMKRPGNVLRMFTGTVDGLPYRVYGYRSKEDPKTVIDEYDHQMESAGWLSVANPIYEGMPHQGSEGRSYIQSDKGLGGVISAVRSPEGDTMVGVAEVTDGVIRPPTAPKEADTF
jgi:hypothetical protein